MCKMLSTPLKHAVIAGCLLITTACLFAQNPAVQIRVDVPLVSVDVSVLDPAGRPLTNLTQEDFQVFEDGQERELKSFSPIETPHNILALFDCTGSTREAWPFLLRSLNGFFTTLRPQDRISVLAFGDGNSTILDWTSRGAQPLNVQMRMPSPLCDRTNFYGAIASAVTKTRNITGRKGAIVFTDGVHGGIPSRVEKVGSLRLNRFVDPSEDEAFLAIRRAVERSETVFYFIAVNTDLSPSNVDAAGLFPGTQYTPLSLFNLQQVRSRMQQIAHVSGGRVVLSQRNSDTGVLFEQIVRELGTSYSLSFTPAGTLDANFHRIEVRVRGPGIRVRQSRDGYYAR
jgi:VWFA-related protein